MSVFMLDCDPVTSGANTINSLANQISNAIDSISSYDTNCEDGFDFSSVKTQILTNVEACTTKFKNTSIYIENVVSSHTSLQKSLIQAKAETTENTSTSTGYNSSSNGNYSNGNYTGGSSSTISGGVGIASALSRVAENSIGQDSEENAITDKIKEVNNVGINLDKLDESLKNDYINKVTYNADGYAMIDDHYVVLCDESIGTVGDELVFRNNDGEDIKCVVGISFEKLTTNNTKSNVSFIVNENWNSENKNNINIDMTKCTVTNNGQLNVNTNNSTSKSTILVNLISSTDNQSLENEIVKM